MSVGSVVFSLDFELGWGHRWTRPSYVERLRSGGDDIRERIGDLIGLFERYDVPATWAVVGGLVEPGDDPVYHAPDLFERLLGSETRHEIGLHSYAHEPYDQLSSDEAREDLVDGINAIEEWGHSVDSFVFPENKIAHLDLLKEADIGCYRGAPNSWLSSFPRGLFTPETFTVSDQEADPVNVPSSMFLAARRPSQLRRRYALRGLDKASSTGSMVHYWLHPHNVVTDPSLLSEIKTLLKQARSAAERGSIRIQTLSQRANDSTD